MFLKRLDIKDKNSFLAGLNENVDTDCDYDTFILNRQKLTSDYFGEIKWGRILIYKVIHGLFSKRILFKVTGNIDSDNILEINIFPYNYWWTLTSSILLTLFAILTAIKFNFLIGVIILLITFIQFIYDIFLFQKHRTKLLTDLKTIIEKNKNEA